MVPYLPKAAARDSSLVSKLSPPINNLPSSDIFSVAKKNQNHVSAQSDNHLVLIKVANDGTNTESRSPRSSCNGHNLICKSTIRSVSTKNRLN